MSYFANQELLQIEEATIIRYGDFKSFTDAEYSNNTAMKIWRLLMHLNKYAACGKNDPFVSRTTAIMAPFMGSEVDSSGKPTLPHRIIEEPQKKYFVATFAELDPLRRYMDPDVTVSQYGAGGSAYDAVREYIESRAETLTS